jgi:hypothetical protein
MNECSLVKLHNFSYDKIHFYRRTLVSCCYFRHLVFTSGIDAVDVARQLEQATSILIPSQVMDNRFRPSYSMVPSQSTIVDRPTEKFTVEYDSSKVNVHLTFVDEENRCCHNRMGI